MEAYGAFPGQCIIGSTIFDKRLFFMIKGVREESLNSFLS
jgi:hypothetical protein